MVTNARTFVRPNWARGLWLLRAEKYYIHGGDYNHFLVRVFTRRYYSYCFAPFFISTETNVSLKHEFEKITKDLIPRIQEKRQQ